MALNRKQICCMVGSQNLSLGSSLLSWAFSSGTSRAIRGENQLRITVRKCGISKRKGKKINIKGRHLGKRGREFIGGSKELREGKREQEKTKRRKCEVQNDFCH